MGANSAKLAVFQHFWAKGPLNKEPPRPMAWAECGVRSELKQRFQYHFIVLWTVENLPLLNDIRNKLMIATSCFCVGGTCVVIQGLMLRRFRMQQTTSPLSRITF